MVRIPDFVLSHGSLGTKLFIPLEQRRVVHVQFLHIEYLTRAWKRGLTLLPPRAPDAT